MKFFSLPSRQFFNSRKAAAALPIVLLVGGLMVEIGIAGAFISYFLGQSSFGVKLSEEALMAAQSGIQDAKIKIVRNKNFIPSPNPYTITVGNRSAQVTVCKDTRTASSTCDTAMVGKYEITSLGEALTKYRRVRAILYVDDTTGEVKLELEREIIL